MFNLMQTVCLKVGCDTSICAATVLGASGAKMLVNFVVRLAHVIDIGIENLLIYSL
jgi:hypothetical protein